MTDYPFDMQLVVDPLNPGNVVRDGAVYLYDPSDTAGVSPLTLEDPSGLPLPNPLTSNAFGFTQPFLATTPQVKWKSGTFEGFFNSYDGLRNEAIAARAAAEAAQGSASTAAADAAAVTSAALAGAVADAESAQAAAQSAAALVGAPADAAIAAAVNGTGTATKAALNATYASRAVELGRFPAFAPKLPALVTTDAPTITYTDHTTASPFTTLVQPTDARLTFHGFVAGTRNVNGNSTWVNLANGYLGSKDYASATEMGTYSPYDIEFDYYGTGVALHTIGLQATYLWQVYVDGLPVSTSPLSMDSARTGVSYGQFAALTWGAAKLRRIRLRLPANLALMGIRIGTNDSLSPAKKAAAKAFVLGDSWVEAVGAASAFTGFASSLGLLTGWEIYRGGQGGTGYVNQATGGLSEFGSQARRNPIKDVQPDYLILAGTSNDDSSAATVGAAASALYAAIAVDSPKTKIIVVGAQNTSSNVAANRELVRAAIITAANAAPNVIGVIDPITSQWITGSGSVSAPGAAGNASIFVGGTTGSDTAHLNQAGHDYWARRVLAALPATAV